MRIKITELASGPGPAETLVGIRKADGSQEEVVLSQRLLKERGIDIGNPLLQDDGRFLIELPRESVAGRWRIWVSSSELMPSFHIEATA